MKKIILLLVTTAFLCFLPSGCLFEPEPEDAYDGLYLKDCDVDVILDYLKTTTKYTYYTNKDMFRIYLLGLNEGYTKGINGIVDDTINEFVYDEKYQELLEEYEPLTEW